VSYRTVEVLLARLLGPSQPEIQCQSCFDLLDVFVEAELAGMAADRVVPGLREHVSGCAACREEYESLRDLAGARIRIA
jgi:hypothetical protein